MAVQNEGRHAAEFILSEAAGMRSRDNAVLLADEVVVAGEVLGKLLPDLGAADATVGTGNGVMTLGNPKTSATVKEGVWTVVCIEPGADVGTFQVLDPDGVLDGVATVGVAYTGNIKFTIADGSTDFAAGDVIPVTVTRADPTGVGKYVDLDLAATDGGAVAAAVALDGYDATGADKAIAIIARDAEVNGNLLTWPDGITAGEKTAAIAQLATHGIIVR